MNKALHAALFAIATFAASGAWAADSAPAAPCAASGTAGAGCPGMMGGGMMGNGAMGSGAMGSGAMGGGMRHGPHWGQGYTPGWTMMTPAERDEHRHMMTSFKTYEECRAYIDKFHTEMAARAQTRGMPMPATPPHDACAGLPKAAKKK